MTTHDNLMKGPVPKLVVDMWLSYASFDSGVFVEEIKKRCFRVIHELVRLLSEISERVDHKIRVLGGKSAQWSQANDKQSVLSTALVWDACDRVIELAETGLAGVLSAQASSHYELLEDAVAELQCWGEDLAGDDDDENRPPSPADDDPLQPLGWTMKKLSRNDTEMRALLKTTLDKLKHIKLLYPPIIKRRLRKFHQSLASPSSSLPQQSLSAKEQGECLQEQELRALPQESGNMSPARRLDLSMQNLQGIPEITDDTAAALYEGNVDGVNASLNLCVARAKNTAMLMALDWEGKSDQLTTWLAKWNEML
ncbi:MAG: hypothetical protein M1815_002396 [Lichina confinis]|nr:MAG: hypothetical protein M1815_002396 [Lichina confinis]